MKVAFSFLIYLRLLGVKMEHKCLFETRGECIISEFEARITQLSQCRDNIDKHLATCHLSQLIGTVEEYELILNRSGLYGISPDKLDRLWICDKHRSNMGKKWRPRQTCQYPLHCGPRKQLRTRNAVNTDISKDIRTLFGKNIPIGSRKSYHSVEKYNQSPFLLWGTSHWRGVVDFLWSIICLQGGAYKLNLFYIVFVLFFIFDCLFNHNIAYLQWFSVLCVSCFNLHKNKLEENMTWMQGQEAQEHQHEDESSRLIISTWFL